MACEIISLSEARRKVGGCKHVNMVVDENLDVLECEDCGERLNPISALIRLAREESRLERLIKEVNVSIEKLDKKKRTQCRHCGKMTPIRY